MMYQLLLICTLMLSWVGLYAEEHVEISDYEKLVERSAKQFKEWVKIHPDGVVVLPSGKLGQKLSVYLDNVNGSRLKLVQQDEYYPFEYAKKKESVLKLASQLKIPSENVLLLKRRTPEQIEEEIASWGGIGFFIGEIDLDGNVGYLSEGKTKISPLNYSQAAQAAKDFGGIEHSRKVSSISLGLETAMNKNVEVILIADGESKGEGVARLIEENRFPHAQYCITEAAGCCLEAQMTDPNEVIIDAALKANKEILKLSRSDVLKHQAGKTVLEKEELQPLLQRVHENLLAKIERGLNLPNGKKILHTSPHHDDIMLSYHPMLKPLELRNQNQYAYFTSGYNSVTDNYMLKMLYGMPEHEIDLYQKEIFRLSTEQLIKKFNEASAQNDAQKMSYWENLLFFHNAGIVFGTPDPTNLKKQVRWLKTVYFPSKEAGGPDTEAVSVMKGVVREAESERMLMELGIERKQIHHLRLPFYGGNPVSERDVKQVLDLYTSFHPDVITLALDPKSTGPDTHYKVLQINAKALKNSPLSPKVWGYRNVWHRFKTADASIISPASDQEMKRMNHAFICCFTTQKNASFPAHNFDGPFSGLAEKIEREQFEQIKTLLGERLIQEHPNPAMRDAKGFVFIKEMSKDEFLNDYLEED